MRALRSLGAEGAHRAPLGTLAAFLILALPACTTVGRAIYFDGARMEEAIGRFMAEVRGMPAAGTDASPAAGAEAGPPAAPAAARPEVDLRAVQMTTPAILALRDRMSARFPILVPLFDRGNIGEAKDARVVILRDEGLDVNQLAGLEDVVNLENKDRMALFREIVAANGYTDWQITRIQAATAQKLREMMRPGWYHQTWDGRWREQMEGVWPTMKPAPASPPAPTPPPTPKEPGAGEK